MENRRAPDRGAPTYVLTADFGTGGVKVGVVDRSSTLVAVTVENYPLSRPAPMYAEQRPGDWWSAFVRAVADLRVRVPDLAERIGAIAFSAQMCGVVCVDAAGHPLRPAIIWLDKRAADITRSVVGGFPEAFGYNIPKAIAWLAIANGGPPRNGMDPPSKMVWVREHEPEIWAATAKILDVRDWLVHRAAGRFVTTADSANLTWLMDTRQGREGWSERLCRMIGVPRDLMPEIVDGSDVVGGLTAQAAAELDLPLGLPVVAGCGDVTATALGSGAVEYGELHVCAGTSSWVGGFFPDRRVSARHSYATVASPVGFRPLLIATQETCGGAFHWLSEVLAGLGGHLEDDIGDFIASAAKRDLDDPLFLPWLAGERCPIDDHRLRGTLLGLRFGHTRETLIRAVIDGTVLNLRWALEVVGRERGVREEPPLPLVGGVGQSPEFAQALADATGRTVVVVTPRFAGLVGAAAFAAPALGWAKDPLAAIRAAVRTDAREYRPDPREKRFFDLRFAEFTSARRWVLPWSRRRHAGIGEFGGGGR
ncbi:MAG: FGGY family carbohydrate kinase [Siculibacillus sp.]|nr:FGGY family carbohydrate kinase [Siculibacillus sp.]